MSFKLCDRLSTVASRDFTAISCFLLFSYVFPCFPMFFYVSQWFSYVFPCFTMFFSVFQCSAIFSPIFLCFPAFSPVFPWFSLFSYVFPCFPMLSPCFPMFFPVSHVFQCFPLLQKIIYRFRARAKSEALVNNNVKRGWPGKWHQDQ